MSNVPNDQRCGAGPGTLAACTTGQIRKGIWVSFRERKGIRVSSGIAKDIFSLSQKDISRVHNGQNTKRHPGVFSGTKRHPGFFSGIAKDISVYPQKDIFSFYQLVVKMFLFSNYYYYCDVRGTPRALTVIRRLASPRPAVGRWAAQRRSATQRRPGAAACPGARTSRALYHTIPLPLESSSPHPNPHNV